jgi:predicted peptidase
MPVKTLYCFCIAGVITLLSCGALKSDTGYFILRQTMSQDSATQLKNRLRAVSDAAFEQYRFTGSNGTVIPYRLLRPLHAAAGSRYPLVLVLHSSGGIGSDNTAQMGVLARFWAQPAIREKYPAFVVAPQFAQRSANYQADTARKVLTSVPDASLGIMLHLIDSLKKTLPVDAGRVYVMGFSMGASSTMHALVLRPDLFAAAVAISGIPAFNHTATLAQTPLWLVHGNADTENPFASDSLLYKELQHAKAKQLRFWEIDRLGHDIYPDLYTTELIPQWLFSRQKQ